MSVDAITTALKLNIDRSSAKFVLVAMAYCANNELTCWPSVQYLCEATSQDRKTVLENIKRLKELGLVVDCGDRKGMTRQVVVYQLCLDRESQNRNSSEIGTVPETEGNSPVFTLKQAQKRDTERLELSRTISNTHPVCKEEKTPMVSIDTFLKNKKASGEKPVPDGDAIFDYAEKVGIPTDMLFLCWREFVERNRESGKRYKDWRQAFRNCVRANWYKLWFSTVDGFQLTTQGKQAELLHGVAA